MKYSCNNDLIKQFSDFNLYIQTCKNQQLIIKCQGSPETINESKNLDSNPFTQIFEFNANSSCHFKMSIDNDNNFRIMSSQQPVINQCICQHEQKKQQQKQKQKAKQLKPKLKNEKSQENSDSKKSQKQSKIHTQVNEDIRILEDKIRLYTSEIDESKKKTLNLPIKWIKKLGTQNKRI